MKTKAMCHPGYDHNGFVATHPTYVILMTTYIFKNRKVFFDSHT